MRQDSNLFLILSIVAGCLIVAGSVVFVQWRHMTGADAPAVETTVTIPASMSVCRYEERCIMAETSCSLCCQYVAINALHETLYKEIFNDACQAHKGATCDCPELSAYPSCVDGTCQMVPINGATNTP